MNQTRTNMNRTNLKRSGGGGGDANIDCKLLHPRTLSNMIIAAREKGEEDEETEEEQAGEVEEEWEVEMELEKSEDQDPITIQQDNIDYCKKLDWPEEGCIII